MRATSSALLVAALTAGGLLAGPASPALAAPEPEHTWTFSDPNGADWTVPAGVSQVWVGIRGGEGGSDSGATLCHGGGRGNQFSVLLEVRAGDVITTYSGKSATGNGDERIGGKGFLNGGDGGKRSTASSVGGGGGGAGAVKLNGELIAVAGGGGGCGGESGYIPHLDGTFWTRAGGEGGTAINLSFGAGKDGEGKKGGRGASAGQDDSAFAGYHKPGLNGSNASTGSSGGGGGGGGAGYPASGAGGGAGYGFAGFNGGGGGGAGLSWVKAGVQMRQFTQPEDSHYKEPIPAADRGESKITIPLTSTTKLTGPGSVQAGETFNVRVRTGSWGNANSMLDGAFRLYVDGVEHPAVNPGAPSDTSYSTSGDLSVALSGLTVGTHLIVAKFSPASAQSYWNSTGFASEASLLVSVTEPTPPAPDDPEKLDTQIELTVPENVVYGTSGTLKFHLAPSGAGDQPLGGGEVSIHLDGNTANTFSVPEDALFLRGTVNLNSALDAGEHRVSASYTGSALADAFFTDTRTFTIAPATTTTSLAAPTSGSAGAPVTATATVASSAPNLTGTVDLLAGTTVLARAELDGTGTATFPAVSVPSGTTELSARYTGDSRGNFSPSSSPASPYEVLDAETRTTLALSANEVRQKDPVTFTATVTNLSDSADPRGEVEILFDNEVIETIPVGNDIDPEAGDAEAVFELETSGFALGEHTVHARFLPAAGFSESATATPATLTITGTTTELTAKATPGSANQPATVAVEASADGEEEAPAGYVQAYVSEEVELADSDASARSSARTAAPFSTEDPTAAPAGQQPVGDPVELEAGAGTVSLDGLPAGSHPITLRFVPADESHLASTATVTAEVAGAGGGSGGSGSGSGSETGTGSGTSSAGNSGAKSGALSTTGGTDQLALGFVSGALLLAGATASLIALRRRRGATVAHSAK